MSGRWREPRSCSVIGAAHRRRGQPCQDASLTARLHTSAGDPLQLMAVADGHGNRRHWLSQVGSALACREAQAAVQVALARTPLTDLTGWHQLLRHELPAAIVQGWLAATAADWAERAEAAGQAYSSEAYGCTLGLVLLAPRWWGHTGLGDWDLVRLDAAGLGTLISEEASDAAAGEATASLCLPRAEALFAERSSLQPLAAVELEGTELALVLSSDGVRKSCATDADFLQLCAQLCAISDPAELVAGLEQITSQGSGDDVSVAVGQWQGVPDLPAVEPQAAPDLQPSPICRRRSVSPSSMATLATLTALGLISGSGWWLWRHQQPRALPPQPVVPAASAPSPKLPAPVAAEIARQCAQPDRIRATLNQRRPQFRQLLSGSPAEPLLAAADRDPLGALIAASRLGHLDTCSALQRELALQWRDGRMPSGSAGSHSPAPMPRSQP